MGCSPSRGNVLQTEIITTKIPEYLCRSTDVKHSLGLLVEVKGFTDAVISLCGPQEEADYEVTIGASSNSLCRMRSTRDPDLAAQCSAFGILDQSGYRGLWLTWRSSQLCLGKGYKPGQQEMLSMPAAQQQQQQQHQAAYTAATDDTYKPYCIKVACPTAGSRVCFRNPRLLFEDDI